MKKYIIPFAVLLGAAAFTSCNDQLDIEPYDRVSEADYFKSENELLLFTNPLYNNILPKDIFTEQSDLLVEDDLSAELRGGSFRSLPSTNGGGGWKWTDLRRINSLLARIDRCPDEKAVTKYTAIARFFRAYFYMEKVVRFGDVPWYEVEVGSADADLLYKDRDSREYVMTKMLEDVNYAIENLPDVKEQTNMPYRLTKWAALALKSRFCLFEGTFRKYHGLELEGHDWRYYLEQSIEASQQLIEKGPYKVYTTGKPQSDYNALFKSEKANADEYILAIAYDKTTQTFHDAYGYSNTIGRGVPGYTRKMINMYLMKDGSRFTDKEGWQEMTYDKEIVDRDPRLLQSIRYPGYSIAGVAKPMNMYESTTGYNPIKFVPDGVSRNDNCTNDMPVFRFSEILLNHAEAKAELGSLKQEDLESTINKLRDRVGMAHLVMDNANANPDIFLGGAEYGYPNVSGANKGVILEIRRERAVELVQEGFRWADIRRWKAGKCFDQPITGMYFPGTGSYDLNGDGKAEIVIVGQGEEKPSADGVLAFELNQDLFLTDGNSGYVDYHKNVARVPFNEDRDYLYPISTYDIDLVKAAGHTLTQNPGW